MLVEDAASEPTAIPSESDGSSLRELTKRMGTMELGDKVAHSQVVGSSEYQALGLQGSGGQIEKSLATSGEPSPQQNCGRGMFIEFVMRL